MRAVDVACDFVCRYGGEIEITNLKLNKLVYYSQVESLRSRGLPLFPERVEAWKYGPVVPEVYREFKRFGSERITRCDGASIAGEARELVDYVAGTYGRMTAYDLVNLSHRWGGAWSASYAPGENREITIDAMRSSSDFKGFPGFSATVARGIEEAYRSIPNALKLLENS